MKEERRQERVEERGEIETKRMLFIFFLISPLKLKVLRSEARIKLKFTHVITRSLGMRIRNSSKKLDCIIFTSR